jgi:hypothetical protein
MDDETQRCEKSIGEMIDSLELVSARLVEAVSRTAQLASSATPEMQRIFNEWLAIVGDQIRNCVGDDGDVDVAGIAHRIGIDESTVFSVLLALHRNGKIRIERVKAVVTDARDTEICGCLLKGGESHSH